MARVLKLQRRRHALPLHRQTLHLEELSKICECKRLILPVFYQVDPSDVRKQGGPFFGKHFREHEEKVIEKKIEEGKVKKWREAMKTAGGKAGYVSKTKTGTYCVNTYVCLILLIELCSRVKHFSNFESFSEMWQFALQ